MGIGIERTCRWLIVICVAVEIAIPWTNASAAEFGFSGMHVQGVNSGIAKALGLPKAEGVLVMDVALGGRLTLPKSSAAIGLRILTALRLIRLNGW